MSCCCLPAQSLVGLNFNQEAVEADMRYGLVRVRENAESIAFYGGQANEMAALKEVRDRPGRQSAGTVASTGYQLSGVLVLSR